MQFLRLITKPLWMLLAPMILLLVLVIDCLLEEEKES
jgi:hypothetical protein